MRRLRKSIELARMNPARHDVIARAGWSRLAEDRRLDLEITARIQEAPCDLRETMTHDQIRLQLRSAQIEVPVFEPQLLGGELLALAKRDGNCRRFRLRQNCEHRRLHLDVAASHLGIPHLRRTQTDFPRNFDNRLLAESGRG